MIQWFLVLAFTHISVSAESKEDLIHRLNNRFSDFFERLQTEEARERVRRGGAHEIKKERQKQVELHEVARKRFAQNRKPPVDDTPAFERHLAQIQAEKNVHLEKERAYAKTRREIEEILKRGRKIPDAQEYQLQDAL